MNCTENRSLVVAALLFGSLACRVAPPSPDAPSMALAGADPDAARAPSAPSSVAPDGSASAPAADTGVSTSAIQATVGSSGVIEIDDDALLAQFFEDDTIVRSTAAPACVAHVRSGTKAASPAGSLTLSGDEFGKPGGLPATMRVDPSGNAYEAFPDAPFFPRDSSAIVQIQSSGTTTFPPVPVTTLRSPGPGTTVITAPAIPEEGGEVTVKSSEPFVVTWTKLPGAVKTQRLLVGLVFIDGGAHIADLFCDFDYAAGTGSVPASILGELRRRLADSGAPATARQLRLRIQSGDQRILTAGTASYVIQLKHVDSTSFVERPAVLD